MTLIFTFLVIASLALMIKYNEKLSTFLTILIAVSTIYLMTGTLEPEGHHWEVLGVLSLLVTISFVLGTIVQNIVLKIILPFISVGVLFLVGNDASKFGEVTINFSSLSILIPIILGVVAGMLTDLKSSVLIKWFPELNSPGAIVNNASNLQVTIDGMLIGLFAIFASFFASNFGFLLMAVGLLVYDLYQNNKRQNAVLSLLALATISYFVKIYDVQSIDLTIGKVVGGLIVGGASLFLIAIGERLHNKFLGITTLLISLIISIVALKLNNINPGYGGIDVFLALIIGASLVGFIVKSKIAQHLFFTSLIVVGLLLPNNPFENKQETIQISAGNSKSGSTSETAKPKSIDELKGLDMSEFTGNYTVDTKTALIDFKLGPKGSVTEGQIPNFTGKVNIAENLENSKFDIELPAKNVTTLNAMRDESLMEEPYFQVSKYPTMRYLSTQMTAKDDGYLLKGKFTMLGKSLDQEVFVKCVENQDGNLILMGKSSLNKSKFGFLPSPQEGDIVDFNFTILLIK